MDPATNLAYGLHVNRYTVISTLGTTTVKSAPGLFYGFTAVSTGTAAMTVTAYDITSAGTNTLGPATTPGALGFGGALGASGCGVAFTGSLVVVTSGTAGTYNLLWD
jgi:hypothetical protein